MGAAQATLVIGDIITAIGEETVSSPQDVSNIVCDLPIGEVVDVEVRRVLSAAIERIPVEVAAVYPSYSIEYVHAIHCRLVLVIDHHHII
jgi:S1-C subfamily serine protease